MKTKFKNAKGITLIALVITIIVLLILAGVTIATLTGNNGILTKANEAKISNTDSEASEQFAILANEWAIEKNTNNKTLGEFLNKKRTEGKLSSVEDNGNETYTIKQNGYQTIIDKNGKISSVFNPEEWDKTATPEECFEWGSDIKGEEGYNLIVGYTDKLQNEVKMKIPSRCTKIQVDSYGSNTDSRSFCTEIKTIEIPNTVIEIGRAAFAASNWGKGFGALQKVSIPDSVEKIGSDAFLHCINLIEIKIPDSVTSIGYSAFWGCTSLSSITIPNSVTKIENGVFSGWTSSQTINIQGYTSTPSGWNSSWNSNCSATINWGQ